MFDRTSRYALQGTYVTITPDGRQATAVIIPVPRDEISAGQHRRREGERLDLLAARYLKDPAAFWRICDLAGSTVPAAVEARPLISIPRSARP